MTTKGRWKIPAHGAFGSMSFEIHVNEYNGETIIKVNLDRSQSVSIISFARTLHY